MDETRLDLARTGEEEPWAFWRVFADAELFLLLTEDAQGSDLSPQVFQVSDGPMVLAFDREDRMAGFSPVPVPYAALPGRVLAALAAGQGLSVGLNLGTGAASEMVLPPEALDWLGETLAGAPTEESAGVVQAVAAPMIEARALAVVEAAIAGALGLAGEALFAQVSWQGGQRGQVLAFIGVDLRDQPAVARAVTEALALSGLDAAALDVLFPGAETALVASLRRVGRRYVARAPVGDASVGDAPVEDAPVEDAPVGDAPAAPVGPGMDKARPPRLK